MAKPSDSQKKIGILLAILFSSVIFVVDFLFFNGDTRIIFGILFVGYFPGFSVFNAFLIDDKSQNELEAFLFCVTGSIVLVSIISLILAISPIGFTANSVLFGLVIITDIFCSVAVLRRSKQLGSRLLRKEGSDNSQKYPKAKMEIIASGTFYLILLLLIVIGVYAVSWPKKEEAFTEFYFSDPGQITSGNLSSGAERPVSISITINNHEGADILYKVQAIAVTTNGENIILDNQNILVIKDSTEEIELNLNTQSIDIRTIVFSLYLPGESNPHRTLEFVVQNDDSP